MSQNHNVMNIVRILIWSFAVCTYRVTMSSLVTHNVETFDVYFCNFTIQNFFFNFLTNTINLLKTLLTIFMPFLCLLSWNWILDNKNTRCLPHFVFARVFTPKLSWYLYWINRRTRPFSKFHMYGKLKRFVISLYVLEFFRIVSRKTKQKTKKQKQKQTTTTTAKTSIYNPYFTFWSCWQHRWTKVIYSTFHVFVINKGWWLLTSVSGNMNFILDCAQQ